MPCCRAIVTPGRGERTSAGAGAGRRRASPGAALPRWHHGRDQVHPAAERGDPLGEVAGVQGGTKIATGTSEIPMTLAKPSRTLPSMHLT